MDLLVVLIGEEEGEGDKGEMGQGGGRDQDMKRMDMLVDQEASL